MKRPSNNVGDYKDVSLLFPSNYLRGAEIKGKLVTVTIDRLEPRHELKDSNGKSSFKPVLYFKNATKGLVLNKTNAMVIASLHGSAIEDWYGKDISLTTEHGIWFGKAADAVRVSPHKPNGKSATPEPDDLPDFDEHTGELY